MNTKLPINDLLAYMQVARERSFTRAAAKLGVSQSRLSQTVRSLEERLGVRLLNRTTRSVALTEAGEHLLRNIGPRFQEIEAELEVLSDFGAKPSGVVRLTATENAAASVLWPALRRMTPEYPEIHVEVSIDNGPMDIVAEGFDAGIRHGELVSKDMIAVPVGPDLRMAVVATPGYFKHRGIPKSPQHLTGHNCINVRMPGTGGLYAWEFEKRGHELHVRVDGSLVVTTSPATLTAALAGLGVGYVPQEAAEPYLKSGLLQRVMEDWCEPFDGYHLYYPNRRRHSAAFATLVEFLRYNPKRLKR